MEMATGIALKVVVAMGFISLLISNADADVVEFGYNKGSKNGPDQWGSLNSEWRTCNSGSQQSPIDIAKDDAKHDSSLQNLRRDYTSAKAVLVNNGFDIEELQKLTMAKIKTVNVGGAVFLGTPFLATQSEGKRFITSEENSPLQYQEGVGNVLVDGRNFSLQQLLWHSPSEHTIDGERFPVELQMVHKSNDGQIAIVAILYQYGHADTFLNQLADYLKDLAKEKCSRANEESHVPVGVVENKALKRATRKYFRYVGSLTAPPCTENIIWTVMGKVREMTPDQVVALKAPLPDEFRNNSRPTQPLNGRIVKLYDETK